MFRTNSARVRLALLPEGFVGIHHDVQHPEQLGLLALRQDRHQHPVHTGGLRNQSLGGPQPEWRQAEEVPPGVLRIPKTLHQAAGREPSGDLRGSRAIQRDPFAQRLLVDVRFRAQRVEHGELG